MCSRYTAIREVYKRQNTAKAQLPWPTSFSSTAICKSLDFSVDVFLFVLSKKINSKKIDFYVYNVKYTIYI